MAGALVAPAVVLRFDTVVAVCCTGLGAPALVAFPSNGPGPLIGNSGLVVVFRACVAVRVCAGRLEPSRQLPLGFLKASQGARRGVARVELYDRGRA